MAAYQSIILVHIRDICRRRNRRRRLNLPRLFRRFGILVESASSSSRTMVELGL
jgi:hypothetical protein